MPKIIGTIKIDLSEWYLGNWPDKIADLVQVETSSGNIEIKLDFDGEPYERVAREIATEAIEDFLSESLIYDFSEDGLTLTASNDDSLVIGWDGLSMERSAEAFKAAQAWLDSEFKEAIDDMPEDEREEFKRKSGR